MLALKNIEAAASLNYHSDRDKPEKPVTTDQDTLRIFIGLLGISLPIILLVGLRALSNHAQPLESISHYFYTRVSSAFVVTLGILAIFLILYRGKRPIDFYLSTTAGICAGFVVLFPTGNLAPGCGDTNYLYCITYINPEELHSNFHFLSAAVFLLCLAAMSYFRFPKNDSSNEQPNRRDRLIYRVCGIIIVMALLVIGLGKLDILLNKKYFSYPYSGTFWGEAVAVWAFGYSWLLKAGFFSKLVDFFTKDLSSQFK